MKSLTLKDVKYDIVDAEALRFVEQSLTDEQKAQVRNNIGITEMEGKSAYEYAQDGGYTGTEEEFAEKLAKEKFSNPNALTINDKTYDGSEAVSVDTREFVFNVTVLDYETGECEIDVTAAEFLNAYNAGRTMVCMCDGYMRLPFATKEDGQFSFALSLVGAQCDLCNVIVENDLIVATYQGLFGSITINDKTFDGTEEVDFTDTINQMINNKLPKIPTALKNPNKLIFTGAVSGEYDGSGEVTINIPASEEDVTTETVLSDNLFDKSTVTTGKIFYHSSGGATLVEQVTGFYAYVPLRGAGTYIAHICHNYHGDSYATRVPIAKADKSWLQNVTGTLTKIDSTYGYIEFIITQDMIDSGAAFYCYDNSQSVLNTAMIVKDREYPSEYIPYGYIEVEVGNDNVNDKQDNVLKGKTALFFGDSICAGTTVLETAPEHGYGWGGLIGTANKMAWKNYGRNGAVITSITGQTRIVTDQIDLALADYSTADYIIFEGGTNDADYLRSDASNLGTISQTNFSNFDTSKFTGAFEALILKILTSYPNAKIGYIVAQKMGEAPYDSTNSARRQYFDRAVEICKKWGIPYIDLWNGSPLNPALSLHYDSSLSSEQANNNGKYYTDGQHLTLAGYERLSSQIEAWMRTL